MAVDGLLDNGELLRGEGREVGEVKAEPVGLDERALLTGRGRRGRP